MPFARPPIAPPFRPASRRAIIGGMGPRPCRPGRPGLVPSRRDLAMRGLRMCLIAIGCLALLAPPARAQGIAFQPTIGVIPDGVTLSVTPVVTGDRRYVRMGGLDAQFLG